MERDEYILSHIEREPQLLQDLYRKTNLELLYPHMVSGHLQGRILKMLVHMIRPSRILEIGTYSGYSAISMAEGLSGDGHLYTVEANDEQEVFTRPWFEKSEVGDRITFLIGDALQVVPALNLTFDMVFIDADKRRYVEFYEMVMDMVPSGGYILADNTLWGEHVYSGEVRESDLQTRGIMAFNDRVAQDERVETVILPLRDGLTLLRKK